MAFPGSGDDGPPSVGGPEVQDYPESKRMDVLVPAAGEDQPAVGALSASEVGTGYDGEPGETARVPVRGDVCVVAVARGYGRALRRGESAASHAIGIGERVNGHERIPRNPSVEVISGAGRYWPEPRPHSEVGEYVVW